MKLILWDIDGTLALIPAGERAMDLALRELGIPEGTIHAVDYRGRTDRYIGEALLAHYGLPGGERELHALMELYVKHLAEAVATHGGRVLPGIVAILEAVRQRPDLAQGLLTGNLERGAQIKLEHHRVWHYFEFGAFADDSKLRNDLGPHALRRAKDRHGHEFRPEDVFIVGDTPHDIACAKAIGAKCLAVATGHYSAETLAQHGADAVLADLSDPKAFFAVIDRT